MTYNTSIEYVGTGTTTNFAIPFSYTTKDEVKAYIEGLPVAFTFVNDSLIKLPVALPAGDKLKITRETDLTNPKVVYTSGTGVTGDSLNRSVKQLLQGLQETKDGGTSGGSSGGTSYVNTDVVNVKAYGALGNGIHDDTLNLQAAFDTGKTVYIPKGKYMVTGTLYLKAGGQLVYGDGANSVIEFDTTANTQIQNVIVVNSTAYNGKLSSILVNHNGVNFSYPNVFANMAFRNGAGDAAGVAVLVMADGYMVNEIYVLNGWDNGIGIGKFNPTTGVQSAGPDHVKVRGCFTFNCGSGRHGWNTPGVPNGYFFQGVGVDILTATNFVVSDCIDYGSYGGFWCDITGGGHGSFNNCIAVNTAIGPIWGDEAGGGNQMWNMTWGGVILYPGSGWDKTPGGLAFYSASYGVQFNNCVAYYPGMYGFVADYESSANAFSNCRVVGSGRQGMIDAGRNNVWTNPVLEGCCTKAGQTAPSGSVGAANLDAFMVKGSTAGDYCKPTIINPVVKDLPHYTTGNTTAVKYAYAIGARSFQLSYNIGTVYVTNGSLHVLGADGCYWIYGIKPGWTITIAGVTYTVATVDNNYTLTLTTPYTGSTAGPLAYTAQSLRYDCHATIIGGNLKAGTLGTLGADANCMIGSMIGDAGTFSINSLNTPALLNLSANGNTNMQVYQDTTGNVTIQNWANGKSVSIGVVGTGNIDFWVNSQNKLKIWNGAVRLVNPPTSSAGLYAGDLWVDTAAGRVVKAV